MDTKALIGALAIGLGTVAQTPLAAARDGADTLPAALAGGEVGLDFRYRIELVDEDGLSEDAEASTLRTRLNYRSGEWNGLQAFVEFSNVREIGLDDFNAGAGATPGRTEFPVVADPEDTRANQAWLGFRPIDALTVRAGRQRIKLDNDRFVGNVGWRQNEQTYDGGSLQWSNDRFDLFYSYVGHVNRIFDSDVPAGDHEHDTHLVNASVDLSGGHNLVGYLYNIEDEDQQAFSSRTFGLRYTGKTGPGDERTLSWLAEFAHQVEAGDNPVDYDANYFHVRADLGLDPLFRPLAGFERLAGSRDAGEAFRTPLATLHAFNGWADRFLATPDRGLDDLYAGFTGRHDRLGWNLIWHRFATETGSDKLGDEIDASLSVGLHRTTSLLLKVAHAAEEDDRITGVTKFWFMLNVALP
ncbi:MAG: alginate export family protein [Wenzhouxiangellaceae bacterium]|nr:alginate export family protein [Wenzhouxiangellaceae bacterium]